jgi:hypothetical protein
LSAIYCTPGPDNSNLIKTENAVPINPDNKANIKYSVPISLALLDKNHLSVQRDILEFFVSFSASVSVSVSVSRAKKKINKIFNFICLSKYIK